MNSLIQLFEHALSSIPEIGEVARQQILEYQRQDPVKLIQFSTQIILSDQVPLLSQKYSFVILCQSFRPTSEMPLNKVKENFHSLDEPTKNNIRQAFIRGLLFEQRDIFQQASFLVALISVIDSPSNSQQVFNILNTFLMSGKYQESVHYAANLAYREIYNSGHLRDIYESVPQCHELLIQQVQNFFGFLRNPTNFPVPFITEVLLTVKSLISAAPFFFQQELIQNDLISILGNLFPFITDIEMFRNAFLLLFELVQNCNDNQSLNINKIIELTSNGLSCTIPDFVSISIDFWNEVFLFEQRIMDGIDLYSRREKVLKEKFGKTNQPLSFEKTLDYLIPHPHKYNGYAVQYAESSFDRILQILFKIDSNDTNIEVINENEYLPHMYAFSFIKKVYPLAQEPVFMKIQSIAEQSISSTDWTRHHGFLLALNAITEPKTPFAEQLFIQCSQFMCACVASSNDRLSETALSAFEAIAKSYPMIYSSPDNFQNIFQLIGSCINRHILIVKRCLNVLRNLMIYPVPNSFFGIIISIILQIIKRPDIYEDDLIYFAYESINDLITKSHDESFDQVMQYLQGHLMVFLELTKSSPMNQQLYTHQKCIFDSIMCIFHKYNRRPQKAQLRDVAGEILKTILVYSEHRSGDILEDIMMTITRIIPFLGDYLSEFEPILIQYIDAALSSQSPSIINSAICVVTNIFEVDPRYGLDRLPNIIDLVLHCLRNKMFTPDFYPLVAKHLSFIITFIHKFEKSHNWTFPDREIFRDNVFQIYKELSTLPQDYQSESGNEFGNKLLEAELLGITAVLEFSTKRDAKFMCDQKNWIFDPLNLFTRLPTVFDETYLAFLKFLQMAMSVLPNKLHVRISKNLPLSIYLSAMTSQRKEVVKEAESLYESYKTFFPN